MSDWISLWIVSRKFDIIPRYGEYEGDYHHSTLFR